MVVIVKILVIEDDPDVLLLCRVNLGFEGHDVIEATDGPQGLDRAFSERPDLIVLDIMLPNSDGLSILTELRRREATRDTPVVFLTAKARTEDERRGWEAGAAFYMTKPFSPAALSEVVAQVAAMAPAEREAQRGEALRKLRLLQAGAERLEATQDHPAVAG